MSLLDDLMQNAETIASEYSNFKNAIEKIANDGEYFTFIIPKGTTQIGRGFFAYAYYLEKVIIPNSVTSIETSAFEYSGITEISLPNSVRRLRSYCFRGCTRLTSVVLSQLITTLDQYSFAGCGISDLSFLENSNVISFGQYVFQYCQSLITAIIPNSITYLGYGAFYGCSNLVNVIIPNSIESLDRNIFMGCEKMENITVENGFNANGLNISSSTLYSTETIVNCLNALADRTGLSAYTITFGSTNIAKLTSEQIAIATNKNWNLA